MQNRSTGTAAVLGKATQWATVQERTALNGSVQGRAHSSTKSGTAGASGELGQSQETATLNQPSVNLLHK